MSTQGPGRWAGDSWSVRIEPTALGFGDQPIAITTHRSLSPAQVRELSAVAHLEADAMGNSAGELYALVLQALTQSRVRLSAVPRPSQQG